MAKPRVRTTDAQIDAALAHARTIADEPRVLSVTYRPGAGLDLLVLHMTDGHRCILPREDIEGLRGAPKSAISRVRLLGNGTGLDWPDLDVQMYVPALLRGSYGTRQWMSSLGKTGGSRTSRAKRTSARANGRKGGRPRKSADTMRVAA